MLNTHENTIILKCLLYKPAHKHVYLIEKALSLVSSLIGPILSNSKNNRNNYMLQELKSWYIHLLAIIRCI